MYTILSSNLLKQNFLLIFSYIIGIIFFYQLSNYTACTLTAHLLLLITLTFTSFIITQKSKNSWFSLAFFFLLAGIRLNFSYVTRTFYLANYITNKAYFQGQIIAVNPPNSRSKFGQELLIKLYTHRIIPNPYVVKVTYLSYTPNINVNNIVSFKALFKEPERLVNISQRNNIIAYTSIKPNELMQIHTLPTTSGWPFSLNRIQNRLKKKMSSIAFTLFNSLFLGKSINTKYATNIKKQWVCLGISHYLARSGLHIMLLLFMWQLLLAGLPILPIMQHILLALLTVFYYVLSYPSISFNRSVFAAMMYLFCKVRNLAIQPIHILNLTCFLILLYNPIELFYIEFQLSFGLTYALLLYNHLNRNR